MNSPYKDMLDRLVQLKMLEEKRHPLYDEQRAVRNGFNKAWREAKILLGYEKPPEPPHDEKQRSRKQQLKDGNADRPAA